MVSTTKTGRFIYPGAAYGPSGVGVWGAVVCALRYAYYRVTAAIAGVHYERIAERMVNENKC